MIEALLPLIITGVLTFAGSAGLWSWLNSKGERPLRKREVENATVTSLREVYGGVLDDLQSELERQGRELANQGDQIKELRTEIRTQAATIEALRSAIRRATAWIDDLHDRWEWHRAQDSPPAKPPMQDQ